MQYDPLLGKSEEDVITISALTVSKAIYMFSSSVQGSIQIFLPIFYNEMGLSDFEVGLITILDILKEYCFVPGKVENWIVIVDTRGKDLNRLPTQVSPMDIFIANVLGFTIPV